MSLRGKTRAFWLAVILATRRSSTIRQRKALRRAALFLAVCIELLTLSIMSASGQSCFFSIH